MNELLKILLIEDNINDCEIELDILKKSGLQFESVVVMNEEQYLQQLDQFQPDVILADYTLPQFNATDALNILHQRSLRLPFILVTGTVSEEFAAGIIKLGADDYILKSSLTRLPSAIESSLQKKKAKQALHLEQERNEFKARLLAKVGQAIIATTIDGAITYWNNAAEKIYGWSADEVMDRNIVDITSVDQSKTQANEIMSDLKAGKSW
ncbi:MAG TPA: response regulator, partial [Hanamia sp.]|nr:response regulator [Hanamia sp.]